MRRLTWPERSTLFLVGALVVGLADHVRAGDAEITVVRQPADNSFVQGRMKTKVFVDVPHDQAMQTSFEEQMKSANRYVCDYTDGKFRFDNVQIVHHPAEKKNADIWWFNHTDRAYAEFGTFGHGNQDLNVKCNGAPTMQTALGRLTIYSFDRDGDGANDSAEEGQTIAHELGHLIFALGDQYEDQAAHDTGTPRGASVSGFNRITELQTGASFFRPIRAFNFPKPDDGRIFFASGGEFKDSQVFSPVPVTKTNVPLYRASGALPWWLQNNTMMQEAEGQVCGKVDANLNLDGKSKRMENPVLWSNQSCRTNADCTSLGGGYVCFRPAPAPVFTAISAPINSELTVNENYDRDRFNLTAGSPVAADTGAGHIQAARHLVVQGFVWPSSDTLLDNTGSPGFDAACPQRSATGNCECPVSGADEGDFGPRPFPGGEIFASSDRFSSSAACPYENRPGALPNTKSLSFGCLRLDQSGCPARLGVTKVGAAPFCGDGTVTIDVPNNIFEQCDNGNGSSNSVKPNVPIVDPDTGMPLRCEDLFSERVKRDLGRRFPVVPFLKGGVVHCGANCNYDLSRCAVPLIDDPTTGTDGSLQLRELRTQSQEWSAAEVFDNLGVITGKRPNVSLLPNGTFPEGSGVNLADIGGSNHIVFSSMRRAYRFLPNGWTAVNPDWHDVWELTLVMDGAEFGGSPGVAKIIRSFELEYDVNYDPACLMNCSQLVSVNRVPFVASDDENTWPRVYLGSTADKNDAHGSQAQTGAFMRGIPSAETELKVDLRGLRVQRVANERGSFYDAFGFPYENRSGPFSSYARNDLKPIPGALPPGPGLPVPLFEIPQYGDIKKRFDRPEDVEFYDTFGFNKETKRYESSMATLDSLSVAFYGQDKASPGYPKSAPVDKATLKANANPFIHSDWERVDRAMCQKWGITPGVPAASIDISHAAPDDAVCPAPVIDWGGVGPFNFNTDTQIVFVLDRSGSMGGKSPSLGDDPGSRLDYVKNAAHVFAETMIANMKSTSATIGPKIGLVYYSDGTEIRIGTGDPATTCDDTHLSQCSDRTKYPGSCLNGHCKTYLPALSETAGPGLITVNELQTAHMRIGRPGIPEEPKPGGFTASGLGLQEGLKLFDPKNPGGKEPTKILMFLTDGQHNRPTGGRCRDNSTPYKDNAACWPGSKAEEAFQKALADAAAKNVLIYDVPLANEIDPATGAIRAGLASGEVFQATRPLGEDAIPSFFAATAAAQGQQLTRSHNTLPDLFSPPTDSEGSATLSYFIDVEPGSTALNLVLSDYDSRKDSFNVSDVEIIPPAGGGSTFFFDAPPANVQTSIDPLSAAMFISHPKEGRWEINALADEDGPKFYLAAHVANPQPNCYVQVNNKTVRDGEDVFVTAQAVFERPVLHGATITGTLLRADKILVDLDFKPDLRTPGQWKAAVSPSDLVSRGQYVATVKCDVEQDAEVASGEAPPNADAAPPAMKANKFHREADATFFFVSSKFVLPGANPQPPGPLRGLPPGYAPVNPHIGDADNDCIPDSQEPPVTVDSDGDGIPDVYDADANGNNINDCVDPAICKGGPCRVADAGPDQILECVANAATGTLDGRASKSSGGALSFAWTAPVPLTNPTTAVATGTFPGATTTTANLTVTDANGSSSDSANVTVMDLMPPTIGTVSPVTVSSCTVPSLATPSASDSCGGTVTLMRDPPVGFKFPVGTTVVTWFAIDRFGNVATKTQNVNVNLATAPTLTPPGSKTFTSCAAGSIGTATATDACGVVLNPTNNAPVKFPVGVTTVTWTATDNNKRMVTKTQTVTLTLSTTPKPTLTVPPNVAVNSCQVPQLGTATGADACGAVVTITNNAPAKFGVGTTTVTWTAKDGKSQTTTKTQLVTITLPQPVPPAITPPPPVTVTNCSTPSLGTATATDACGVSIPVTRGTAKLPLGSSIVVWTATDPQGSTATRTQVVTAELGDDSSCCPAGTTIKQGTSSSETLTGTSGNDCILGKGGDDVITGGDGDDYISGGAGNDNISGGKGNDHVWGGLGQNVATGNEGDDVLIGGPGNDNLSGAAGNDRIEGGDGDDVCSGEGDDDVVLGGNGKDQLSGGTGNDILSGEAGDDTLTGNEGIDSLDGGGGTDTCTVDAQDTRISCEK
jgi:hypothetical protein